MKTGIVFMEITLYKTVLLIPSRLAVAHDFVRVQFLCVQNPAINGPPSSTVILKFVHRTADNCDIETLITTAIFPVGPRRTHETRMQHAGCLCHGIMASTLVRYTSRTLLPMTTQW